MEKCETCTWWMRGSAYTVEKYGDIPARQAWSAQATGGRLQEQGECRIVAPYRCGGCFPVTYEFHGCGEHKPKDTSHD